MNIGQKVKVLRASEDDSRAVPVKYGIVVEKTTSWVRVYDPKDGMDKIDSCEWFAVNSRMCKVIAL